MLHPYIGITDFTAFTQVLDMLEAFRENLPANSRHRLHVGVMMSYKTLHGIDVMNCLHYADYKGRPNLAESLARAIFYGGVGINGLQLDMTWPDPAEIANAVYGSRKHIEVILQVGKFAIEDAHDDPQEVVQRLRDYEGVIHHVLIDKSMGKGLGMDAGAILPFATAIREHFPDLGITAAGGLGPQTMDLVLPLAKEIPDISIDAQGKLRPSGSNLDPVDWDMAEAYLATALQILA